MRVMTQWKYTQHLIVVVMFVVVVAVVGCIKVLVGAFTSASSE
jgi:hypothetical protein